MEKDQIQTKEGDESSLLRLNKRQIDHGFLGRANDWEIYADLIDFKSRPLIEFFNGIISNRRPDIVLKSKQLKTVLLLELTVPAEKNVYNAHNRKEKRYAKLAEDIRTNGFTVELFAFEVGTLGYLSQSFMAMISKLGLYKKELIKYLSDMTLKGSYGIFISRMNPNWQPWPLIEYKMVSNEEEKGNQINPPQTDLRENIDSSGERE